MRSIAAAVERYTETVELSTTLAGQAVRVLARPAIPNSGTITPATAMLAELVPPLSAARVLLIAAWPGLLAVALASQARRSELLVTGANLVALTLAQEMFALNDIANAQVAFDPVNISTQVTECDVVVLETPPDRQLARHWLAAAYRTLRPGGRIYLAGANQQGIRSAIADAAALFGSSMLLGYRERARAAVAVKEVARANEPAWFWEAGIQPNTWHEFQLESRDARLTIRSLPGVFAYDRLDDGTALLLAHLAVPKDGCVLDVGCGSGIIGLTAARRGAAHVDLVDVNLLAVAATRENIAGNQIANARVVPSDVLGAVAGEQYDLIVSNPPFHDGKAVSYGVANALIAQASRALRPGGRLVLVANRFIRYDQVMRRAFHDVEILAATGRYHVLAATRATATPSAPPP